MAAVIAVLVMVAVAALWIGRRRPWIREAEDPAILSFRRDDPGGEERADRLPEFVDHTLDLRAMRYRRTSLFRNEDPWAESDTSQMVREFLVRRTGNGAWEAQLVSRNHSALDTPGEWAPVSVQLAEAWEDGWQRWQK
jgi:hypothetical protein